MPLMTFLFSHVTSLGRAIGTRMQPMCSRAVPQVSHVSTTSSGTRLSEASNEMVNKQNAVSSGGIDSDFEEGRSVNFWKTFNSSSSSSFENLLSDLRSDIRADGSCLPYYTYCFGRSLFFAGQGLLSLQVQSMLTGNGGVGIRTISPSHHLAEAGYTFRQDYDNIRRGLYKPPWDMSIRHRQFNPLHVARNSLRYLASARDTLSKRYSDNPSIDVWMDSISFPAYYKQTFHFQRDGWMSSMSADSYEVSTETLFIGRQDAMQRLALIAISDFMQRYSDNRRPRVLEIGAGTGRLGTFVMDNFPNIDYICNDLSPFYLEKARENVQYWKRFVGNGGSSTKVSYVQAQAENLPVESSSIDVAYSVYLFHELPPDARRNVAKEMARVLKPGGMFALVDSIQIGDRASRDDKLDYFERFNEPWYPSFVREDFGQLFREYGLVPAKKELSSVTKLLTFTKVL